MHIYQSHVVFQSFSDLYSVEKIQQERNSLRSSSSNASSRASSFSEGACMPLPRNKVTLNRYSTKSSVESSSSSSSSSSPVDDYYPAALYNGRVGKREADTATLNDDISASANQDLSLRRF